LASWRRAGRAGRAVDGNHGQIAEIATHVAAFGIELGAPKPITTRSGSILLYTPVPE
jgi:hypothetical protein